MRITVNLATRPFVELRPVLMRLRLIMIGLAAASAVLWIGNGVVSAKLDKQNEQINRLRYQTDAVQRTKLKTETRLRQPEDAAILDRAHFLNALFLRKSFSWTAVMMDLEQVLPTGVQVTSIEPQVGPDGTVVIRMRVAGERDRAVELVRNLERSRRFLQPRLASESAQTKENGNAQAGPVAQNGMPAGPVAVDFDVLANYNPLPEGESYPKAKAVQTAAETPAAPTMIMGTPVAPEAAQRLGMRSQGAANGKYPPGGVRLKPFAGQPAANNPGRPQ